MKNHIQPYLFIILLLFLIAGYFYPAIGITAIICMLAPVIIAPFKGRYWCGNFCPRGSFYDTVVTRISPNRPVPRLFQSTTFRTLTLIFIMTTFCTQMYRTWGNADAMGLVFLRIILITTIVGTILGMVYQQRAWCRFCPMGTLANWFSGRTKPLIVSQSCVSCGLCTKTCPLELAPYVDKGSNFSNPDCLKCRRCVETCPRKALHFD